MSDTQDKTNSSDRKVPLFSPGRMWIIALSTVTQLVRMKTLYFLLAFAVIIVAFGNFSLGGTPAKELSTIKKAAFGAMDTFAWLFAIVSTALLIPRDVEDRTLYTILSKPVRRIEYLVGKLCGVLVVIGASLALMFIVCSAVIIARESTFIGQELAAMDQSSEYNQEQKISQIEFIQRHGFRPELAIAVVASFLKASVIAAVTILLSTFASSSLFTIIISLLVFVVGHFHSMAKSFYLYHSGDSMVVQLILKLVKILIPDFQLYAFSEGIVLGGAVIYPLVWQMGIVTLGYLVVYLLLSTLVFVDKEF